ncbi:hypothetical protein C8F04DRAFT_1258976 [Mycena alexandri]|uniref:Uncharacterized protein n=1 Tax=Mycena alexandri TaxID=1745969 RepID=A0AAD6SYZ0_9AGAR|nr:hypothetical protein C8F04DRAFT_1258976 [Mycena alexandri]
MPSKHSYTGVAYPSRPQTAPNDGHFACSVGLYTHAGFTDLETHDSDRRRKWLFLKHPVKPAVCSSMVSLTSYLHELNDPNFQPQHLADSGKMVVYTTALELAHAIYKWCYTHHSHQTSPVQKQNIIITKPPVALDDLLFYDATGLHERLKLSPTHPRTGPLFNKEKPGHRRADENGARAVAHAINQVKRARVESNVAPAASQKRARNETAPRGGLVLFDSSDNDARLQNIITYKEAPAAKSAPSAPTGTMASAPTGTVLVSAPTGTALSAPTGTAPSAPTSTVPSAPTDTVASPTGTAASAPTGTALSAPIGTARAANSAPSEPTGTSTAAFVPTGTALSATKSAVTAPACTAPTAAASAPEGAAPAATPQVDPASEEDGPYFYLSDGRIFLDPASAGRALRERAAGMRLVDTLSEVQELRRAARKAAASH